MVCVWTTISIDAFLQSARLSLPSFCLVLDAQALGHRTLSPVAQSS